MSEEPKTVTEEEPKTAETETKSAKVPFRTKVKGGIKNAKDKAVGYVKTHKGKICAIAAGAGLAAYGAFKLLTNAKSEDEYDPDAEFEPGDWLPEENEEEEAPEETSAEEEVPEE